MPLTPEQRFDRIERILEAITRDADDRRREMTDLRRNAAQHEAMFGQIALRFQDTRETIDALALPFTRK